MDEQAYRDLADRANSHWFVVERRAHLKAVIAGLPLPPTARILEIGCGPGSNLGMLKTFGTVTAMEPSAIARELIRTMPGAADVEIHVGTWPESAELLGGATYDLIAMLDVVEHIDDDHAALRAARDALAPGGHVIVTVPAHPWMWSVHDETLHHRRRYTRATLRRVMTTAGLQVDSLGGFNSLLLPIAAAARLTARALRRTASPGRATPGALTNSVLGAVFRSERAVIVRGGFPTGLSLIAIAHRP